MISKRVLISCYSLFISLNVMAGEGDLRVNITNDLPSVEVIHQGNKITIKRDQNKGNQINPDYAITSRDCPPFCIQPISLATGVETIGELEMLNYLQQASQQDSGTIVIDSRTPDWVKKGTIPGARNIPWTELKPGAGASPFKIAEIFEKEFNAVNLEGFWDFSNAKTLVLFCNGIWCGQSPSNIRSLLRLGYPADKLKWYRGGMQDWESLGLTVIR